MNIYIALEKNGATTFQDQIYRHMRELIGSGALPAGTRLPSIRQLATGWCVSRNTVILSLAKLVDEGFVQNRPRLGMFSHANPPVLHRSTEKLARANEPWDAKDFIFLEQERVALPRDHGIPIRFSFDVDDPVFHQPSWQMLARQLLARDWAPGGRFQPNAGLPSLREAIAEWLGKSRGLHVQARQVVIISGFQQAHDILSRILIRPRARVILEAPCYRGKLIAYHAAGAVVLPMGLDRDGIVTHRLPDGPTSLICVNPNYQMPTCVTLSLERRRELIAWADGSGAYVFEEAMNDPLQLEGLMLPPLFALSRSQRVIHAGLFAPTLGGGLSLAYLVLPEPLIEPFLQTKLASDSGQSWFDQELLARFIRDGELDVFLRRRRAAMLRRRDVVVENLSSQFPDVELLGTGHAARLSFLLPATGPSAHTLSVSARERGIGTPSWRELQTAGADESISLDRLMVLGYGAVREADIADGIRRLGEARQAIL